MKKLLNDILTGADNATYDNGRVLCFLSHMVYYVMAFLSYVIGKPWAPIDFATGVAAIAVGFGIHLNLKDKGGANVT